MSPTFAIDSIFTPMRMDGFNNKRENFPRKWTIKIYE